MREKLVFNRNIQQEKGNVYNYTSRYNYFTKTFLELLNNVLSSHSEIRLK
jgi:hypothetical protein